MAIYEQHHKENPMVMELTQEAQALCEGEYTAIIATLNCNWPMTIRSPRSKLPKFGFFTRHFNLLHPLI